MSIRAPRIGFDRTGRLSVERWGKVGNRIIRAGDQFVLGVETENSLLVLIPNGHGRPMLGRRIKGQIFAEPSLVPASPLRWRVMGAVIAIERDLERSVMDGGRWFASVRMERESNGPELNEIESDRME